MEANNLQWYPPHKQKMIWVKNVESRIDSVSRQCRLEDPPCRDKLEKQAISCKPLQWSCQWPLQLQETMRGVSAISLPVHLLPVSFGCLPWLPLCAGKVGSCCHLIAVNWCHPLPPRLSWCPHCQQCQGMSGPWLFVFCSSAGCCSVVS